MLLLETNVDDCLMANAIKKGRKNHKLTQEGLAAKIGVEPRTIQRWEAGQSMPQPLYISKLATIMPEMEGTFREAAAVRKKWYVFIILNKFMNAILSNYCFRAFSTLRIFLTALHNAEEQTFSVPPYKQ